MLHASKRLVAMGFSRKRALELIAPQFQQLVSRLAKAFVTSKEETRILAYWRDECTSNYVNEIRSIVHRVDTPKGRLSSEAIEHELKVLMDGFEHVVYKQFNAPGYENTKKAFESELAAREKATELKINCSEIAGMFYLATPNASAIVKKLFDKVEALRDS